MLKIAVSTHVALLTEIDPAGLSLEVVSAFSKLADLILKARGGSIRQLSDTLPALKLLFRAYPQFTTQSKVARRLDVNEFMVAVQNKMMENRNAPQNLNVISLAPGAYYGTTANNAGEFIDLVDRFNSQFEGEIHAVFNLGEVKGFEFEQLRTLMLTNQSILLAAAKSNAELTNKLSATLGSLKRAKLALPHTTIIVTESATPLKYNDIVGVVDFQTTGAGKFISQREFRSFYINLRDHSKRIIRENGGSVKLSSLKGKKACMIGRPPSGWSTDRFARVLKPYGVTVEAEIDFKTSVALYDPASAPRGRTDRSPTPQHGHDPLPHPDISRISLIPSLYSLPV